MASLHTREKPHLLTLAGRPSVTWFLWDLISYHSSLHSRYYSCRDLLAVPLNTLQAHFQLGVLELPGPSFKNVQELHIVPSLTSFPSIKCLPQQGLPPILSVTDCFCLIPLYPITLLFFLPLVLKWYHLSTCSLFHWDRNIMVTYLFLLTIIAELFTE